MGCQHSYELVSDGAPIPVPVETTPKKPTAASKEAIQRAIGAANALVQACFQEGLKQDPNLVGKVIVRFVLGTQGRIDRIALEDTTIHNALVEACVQYQLTRQTFPKSDGKTEVVYPFYFRVKP